MRMKRERHRGRVVARHVVLLLAQEEIPDASMRELGEIAGRKLGEPPLDHSTVLYHIAWRCKCNAERVKRELAYLKVVHETADAVAVQTVAAHETADAVAVQTVAAKAISDTINALGPLFTMEAATGVIVGLIAAVFVDRDWLERFAAVVCEGYRRDEGEEINPSFQSLALKLEKVDV